MPIKKTKKKSIKKSRICAFLCNCRIVRCLKYFFSKINMFQMQTDINLTISKQSSRSVRWDSCYAYLLMGIFLVLIFVLCSGSFKKIGTLKSQISYTKTIELNPDSKLGDSEFLQLDKKE